LRGRGQLTDSGETEEHRAQRPVRQALSVRQALGDRDRCGRSGSREAVEELLEQASLPDSGRREDADKRRSPI
jgi:hypothetical protein